MQKNINIYTVIVSTTLAGWWRGSSGMTVGQSGLVSLAQRYCDWHPGGRCG